MEFRALVAIAFRAGAKGEEVLGGFGNSLIVELEVNSALLIWKLKGNQLAKVDHLNQ